MSMVTKPTLREMIVELRELIVELRQELRTEFAEIRKRLDVLERPRIARVISDPAARFQEPGGATQR
jgi:hypothetical protein